MARLHALSCAVLLLACAAPGFRANLDAGTRAVERGDVATAAAHWEAALAQADAQTPGPHERVWLLSELGELYFSYIELDAEVRAGELFAEGATLALAALPLSDPLRLRALERHGLYQLEFGDPADARAPLEQFMDEARRQFDPETLHASEASAALLKVYQRIGDKGAYAALARQRKHPLLLEEGAQVTEFAADELYLAPNVRDVDGAGAFVHYTEADMPLRISLGTPDVAAADASPAETAGAASRGFRLWEQRLRTILPWFRLDIVEHDPTAQVQVEWKRRGLYYLPAVGKIEHIVDGEELEVRSRIVLSAKPIPVGSERIARGELTIWTAHAFGSALGLPDCVECESIMAVDWRRRDSHWVSDLDVRTFAALTQKRNGERFDGRRLLPLQQTAQIGAAPAAEGVLADLPIINDGQGTNILIDLSADPARPFPLLLDTGAASTILTTPLARAIGISVRSIKTDPYRRDTITGRPLSFWVTGQAAVGGGRGPSHFQYALLGGEFLREFVLDIDYAGRRVRFLDPALHHIGDERFRLPGEQVFELHMSGTHPYVDVEVGNGTVRALLDTGAMSPLSMTEEKAMALGIEIDREAPRVHFTNVLGTSVKLAQKVASARVGDVELRDLEVYIALRDESDVRIARWLQGEAILGMKVLQHYRVRLDYKRGLVSFTPSVQDAS